MNVFVSTVLEIPAGGAWSLLKRRDTFLFITRHAMSFRGSESWPDNLMVPGVEIATVARPLGFLPGSPHKVRIVSVDEQAMQVATEESGGWIHIWNHTMSVERVTDARCRYTDRVELRAGPLTPVIWLFAGLFYRYRQLRWHRLVRQQTTAV